MTNSKKQKSKKTKLVYFIGYVYDDKLNFLRLHSETYEEALKIAQCMFGKGASKVLFTKNFTVYDE
jgi:hypothetical protein